MKKGNLKDTLIMLFLVAIFLLVAFIAGAQVIHKQVIYNKDTNHPVMTVYTIYHKGYKPTQKDSAENNQKIILFRKCDSLRKIATTRP